MADCLHEHQQLVHQGTDVPISLRRCVDCDVVLLVPDHPGVDIAVSYNATGDRRLIEAIEEAWQ